MKHLYKSLTLIFAITVLAACVTTRKKDEAKGLKLFMHNLTAKYNGFFNANVLVQEATDKLNEQHQDNYNKVLDVYPYLAADNPAAVAPELDKAIEKVAVVATYHRPSHWVDDCYLMMGKAQYLKHDFESAEETFAYLAENYNPSLKKKMSKKDRAKAVAEAREEKKKEREQKAKDAKKAREEAIKEKEKEKKERDRQAEKDKEDREKALKQAKEDEAKKRKEAIQDKKLSLEERNEQKRKENAAKTEQKRKEREEKERLAKQGVKVDKTKPAEITTAPVATTQPTVKKEETKPTTTTKKEEEEATASKTNKPKGKPDKYFLKHRPCYQEGVVWYARALTERQNFVDAEILLDELDKNPKTFKDIKAQSAVARAALYLKQKNYDQAIPALERGISLSKKKKEKARLSYILAQLYQLKGNSEKAYAAFDKVLNYSPAYEMEFNSRLNKALNDTKGGEQTTETLVKMSKDYKNKEYGDQIYFTLAQIALKKGNKPQAIDYLKEALASPGRGKSSKAEAYYMMANLQYEAEKFVEAKNYFDSAATNLAKNDPRRLESERYAQNLLEIARNIETITMQDSLLKVANLSDKEKRELALRIKKEKARQAAAAANPSVAGGAKASEFDLADAAKKSKFWGYNADLVKKGKREFEKKWGTDRKLEDNWRRSNKRSNGDFASTSAAEVVSSEMTAKEYQEIMKDVPKTPKDVETAEAKIDEAMFQLGTLYHDKIKNYNKAISTLENHLARFPKTKHELEDWYYLHLSANETKNSSKAQDYYDKIMSKYATSNYAMLLKDKGKQKAADDTETVEKFYAVTYNMFKDGKYKETQARIKESDTKYGVSNPMKAKFALLEAMCIGHEMGRINYIAQLKEVVNKYAGTPEERRAQEILRILEFGGPVTEAPKNAQNGDGDDDPVKKFIVGEEKLHYVIIILNKNADLEDSKVVVSDYDSKYHRTDALNVSSMFFSTESETPVLVVRKFKDKTAALKYTEGVSKNGQDFLKGVYEVFAISQDNYREVIRQRGIDAYRKFYEQNYR
ncbi:MAG: tetratricopeptide repeat protein [Saprospiraceae bacterium]|nr:tetratricopeptide repeat protein [Saprospiraceae bacterium]